MEPTHNSTIHGIQKIFRIFFILFLLFLFYGSLIPFNFQIRTPPFVGQGISRMDILSNFILYGTYGFLFVITFGKIKKSNILPAILAVISGTLISLIIEYLQCFSIDRSSSIVDVFFNITGTVFGAIAGCIFIYLFFERITNFFSRLWPVYPLYAILLVIIFFFFLDALIPFDISIQVSDIWHNIKNINTRFGDFTNIEEEFIFYILIAFFFFISMKNYNHKGKVEAFGLTMLFCFVLSVFTEFIQLFIVSRVSDSADIVNALAGGFIGILLALLYKRTKIVLIFYIFILFGIFITPLNFTSSFGISWKMFFPFYAYYIGTNYFAVQDLLRGIILFLPLGFLSAKTFSLQDLCPRFNSIGNLSRNSTEHIRNF